MYDFYNILAKKLENLKFREQFAILNWFSISKYTLLEHTSIPTLQLLLN